MAVQRRCPPVFLVAPAVVGWLGSDHRLLRRPARRFQPCL